MESALRENHMMFILKNILSTGKMNLVRFLYSLANRIRMKGRPNIRKNGLILKTPTFPNKITEKRRKLCSLLSKARFEK
jgi:hypothetical protein